MESQKHVFKCFSPWEADGGAFAEQSVSGKGTAVYSDWVCSLRSLLGGEQHCSAKPSLDWWWCLWVRKVDGAKEYCSVT